MKTKKALIFIILFTVIGCFSQLTAIQYETKNNSTDSISKARKKFSKNKEKYRVIIMSDFPHIGVVEVGDDVPNTLKSDPDDMQSMVPFLLYANEFDIEGLIVSTGCWRKTQSNTDMLDKILESYDEVYPNLIVHADGYPTPDYLKAISTMTVQITTLLPF